MEGWPRGPALINEGWHAASPPLKGAGPRGPAPFNPEDPIADSLANESDAAFEPDEVDYPIPPEDGNEDVDINVIAENVAQGTSTSSQPVTAQRTSQETFYRSIPFFEQTFPEVPVDSIDVPNLSIGYLRVQRPSGKYCVGIPPKLCGVDGSCEAFTNQKWEGHVKCNPSYGIKHVIQTVKDHTGYDIAYQKAWYSLKMAREMVYGTWESSVQKLPKYLGALQKYNPGTIVEWQHKARDTSTGAYVIGYVFWAFKPCIEGFQHCRNLISVDGTHLYTKYKHKMLIAAAMDGNQQVLPLAFAVVDEESLLSWKWFLRQLSRHIIRGRRGICLISDRHAGITRAVRECPDFVPPNGVHRYCLRHVCSNFNSKYKNVVLKDLCWRAGSEYQIRKFNRTMEEIKKQSLEAFQWLDRIDKEKWTASHDGGWRCGILTTNMSECIKWSIERGSPPTVDSNC
ncbi:UNVERIFIED_CONTAM: hypothetical protein Sindi_0735500 [Sesamum indicum]